MIIKRQPPHCSWVKFGGLRELQWHWDKRERARVCWGNDPLCYRQIGNKMNQPSSGKGNCIVNHMGLEF